MTTQGKVARPGRPRGAKFGEVVHVRLAPAQRERLAQRLELDARTASEWIRDAIERALLDEQDADA